MIAFEIGEDSDFEGKMRVIDSPVMKHVNTLVFAGILPLPAMFHELTSDGDRASHCLRHLLHSMNVERLSNWTNIRMVEEFAECWIGEYGNGTSGRERIRKVYEEWRFTKLLPNLCRAYGVTSIGSSTPLEMCRNLLSSSTTSKRHGKDAAHIGRLYVDALFLPKRGIKCLDDFQKTLKEQLQELQEQRISSQSKVKMGKGRGKNDLIFAWCLCALESMQDLMALDLEPLIKAKLLPLSFFEFLQEEPINKYSKFLSAKYAMSSRLVLRLHSPSQVPMAMVKIESVEDEEYKSQVSEILKYLIC